MKKQRDRRSLNSDKKTVFVNFLAVIDKSVYEIFQQEYGNLDDGLISKYINIFFVHLINGVNLFLHENE
jgi:hypothetical protein